MLLIFFIFNLNKLVIITIHLCYAHKAINKQSAIVFASLLNPAN